MKKVIGIITIIMLIIGIGSYVDATEEKISMKIVQESSQKELENVEGIITKNIVDLDKNKGEITIELKFKNNKSDTVIPPEIFFVLDLSGSMISDVGNKKTRLNEIINSAIELKSKILEEYKDAKIGIVTFSDNAVLKLNLTNDGNEIQACLEQINKTKPSGGTNIRDGLLTANDKFTAGYENKMIILLTDGIPSNGVDVTKNAIIQVSQSGTFLVSLITGIEKDSPYYPTVESTFGTTDKPIAGKFYSIADIDINKVITKDIFSNVEDKVENPIKNIKIEDYFPQEVIDNFEFSFIGSPSIGNTSKKIDDNKKSFEWNIEKIKTGEIATLRYKLKIKNNINKELINKVLNTNEKVTITCTDTDLKQYEDILEDSPKIKFIENIDSSKPSNEVINNSNILEDKKDNTVSNKDIPQTGEKQVIIAGIAISIISVIVFAYKYNKSNETY